MTCHLFFSLLSTIVTHVSVDETLGYNNKESDKHNCLSNEVWNRENEIN